MPTNAASTDEQAAAPAEASDPVRPAVEVLAFQLALNRANRWFGSSREDYRVTIDSIRRNLRSSWDTDRDPFEINQLGHPYQGAMYHGFGRSAGLDYWRSAGLTFAGSIVWEIAGEQTHPSRNDQIASGVGGTFLGEALFRLSSLTLERGFGMSPFWRDLTATVAAPSAAVNRLMFHDPHAVISSRGALVDSRLDLGYMGHVDADLGSSLIHFRRSELQARVNVDYGLPAKDDYVYRRPFDYFHFDATATTANGIETVLTHGLLIGQRYDPTPSYRGIWGLYGSYDYIAPQAYRVSTTALSLGTTGEWSPRSDIRLRATAMLGLGYAAVGTARGEPGNERDYNYGVAPQALVSLSFIGGDRYSIDLAAHEYFVSRIASGTSGGRDNILRGDASFNLRFARGRAVSLRLLSNRRDARFAPGASGQRQTQNTIGLFYSMLGEDGIAARP